MKKASATGQSLRGTLRDKLQGWELMDLVGDIQAMRQSEVIIGSSSGGWVDLVGDADALVLFASGLKEIKRPSQFPTGLCHEWKTLPKDNYYLAVGVPMLNMFFEHSGHVLKRQYLTRCCRRGPVKLRHAQTDVVGLSVPYP
jgi:hypothetical protein